MHPLVPYFILDHYAAGEPGGELPAVGLFVDISGFSSMTDALMGFGQHGAEVLAGIMRAIFDPLIESVYEQGGFVATSAGDALTALFPVGEVVEDACIRALAAACRIQEIMLAKAEFPTVYQNFHVSAKVGLALGDVRWGIILSTEGHRGACFFQGSAVDSSAAAEHSAKAGEIIVDSGLFAQIHSSVTVEPVESFYRICQVLSILPEPRHFDPPAERSDVIAHFYPEILVSQAHSGEFRQVVNCFINLPSVRTEVQLRMFMESVFALQEKYGGLLDRLDFGDKGTNLLLFWGAPTAQENDIARALNFILALQVVTSIPISAGVTYRIAHAGFIGGRLHEEYTCFGRGVNLAARYMTAAPRGEIWIDEPVAKRASGRFEVEFVKEEYFKGFQQAQKVFVLLERKEETIALFSGNLAGRENDLDSLRLYIQPLFHGKPAGLLVISGEPGIGKSRLLHEFLREIQVMHIVNAQVFLGQTDEILRESLNPVKYWLHQYFGISANLSEARNKRAFHHRLDDLIAAVPDQWLADELDRTRSFLAALVGLEWADSLFEQLDAQGRYQNTLIALTVLLQAESLRAPVFFVLEDTHWLDEDTKAFLTHLLRILTVPTGVDYPIAIIFTSRDPGSGLLIEGLRYTELQLGDLDRQGMNALATAFLAGPPGQNLLDLLVERAEGNPFYAEQILLYLQEEKLLARGKDAWEVNQDQVDALPSDVNALLVVRLDRLAREVKEVVQAASVIGREFEVGLLSAMLREAEITDPLPAVAAAEQESIWAALNEMRYIFRHVLMRDAAYQMLVHTRRQALHSLAFYAIEKIYSVDLEDYYGALAHHAEQARLREEACRYLKLAGEASATVFQNRLAIQYFTRALALTPENALDERFELLLDREAIYSRIGNNVARQADLAELEVLLINLNDAMKSVVILLRQASYAQVVGQSETVDRFANQAIELALQEGLVEEASHAYRLLANTAHRQGRLGKAFDLAQKSLHLARQARSRVEEILSLNLLGLVAIEQGQVEMARRYLNECLAYARETGDLRHQAPPLNNLGMIDGSEGKYIEAREYYQQALEITQKTGDRSGEGIALGNLGFISGCLGEYVQARDYSERFLRIAREINDPYYETRALINLSGFVGTLGEPDLAGQSAREACELARKISDQSGEAWACIYLGHSLMAMGENSRAASAYSEALRIRQELAQPGLAAEPAAGLARAMLAQGDLPTARHHIEPVLAYLEREGTLDGADEPLRVYLTCFLVLQQAGNPRALDLLDAAHALLQERAAKIPVDATRLAFLNNIAHHREIQFAWAKYHPAE